MYRHHFGLAELPFGLTPDTSFAFCTRAHQEALNTLLLATEGGEGFIKIIGEVGTGKTLLCRRFLARLGADGTSKRHGADRQVADKQHGRQVANQQRGQPGADRDNGCGRPGADDASDRLAWGRNDRQCADGQRDPPSADDASRFITCYLPNPHLTPRTLLLSLARELGLDVTSGASEFRLLELINTTLLTLAAEGKRVVVCIDEAQALSAAGLEMLRLLSNLETEKRKLLQLVLFGQPELDTMLSMSNLRQLRQRISFHYRLTALDRDELRLYLEHRLRVAGHMGPKVFTDAAVRAMQRASGGVPRLVNILAHKALLAVFGTGGHVVTERHVREAARDTDIPCRPAPPWLRWLLR